MSCKGETRPADGEGECEHGWRVACRLPESNGAPGGETEGGVEAALRNVGAPSGQIERR